MDGSAAISDQDWSVLPWPSAYTAVTSEINLHIDHFLALGAYGCRGVPIIVHSKIDPSKLAAGAVLRAKRLCHLRKETAFSPESMAGSSEARVN